MKNNSHNDILDCQLEDIVGDRFGRYSKYIIQERALPDIRDGLKPVQRRILYAMQHDGNTSEKAYRKSAKTVGLVIGNYHPHGDFSVYEAMVRLSQDWKVRMPLVDMQGNNGSIDDDPAAAMRYTEARLAKISQTLFTDIEKETVQFAPNFDDTEQEPTVLPAAFPMLLVNGATGIASGYATNIAPSNCGEVIDATIHRINNPTCTLTDIMALYKGPDFPTGGIVQGRKGIIDAFATGKGRVVIRAKCDIVEGKTINQIIITEIPYEVIKANLVKKIDDLRLNKDLENLLDVRDESDRNGLKIVLDIKKDCDSQLILNYLFKNTDLQVYYNYNIVAIINQRPQQLSIMECLDAFIAFREEVVLKRSKYDYQQYAKRLHILEGLIKSISILDEIIDTIRSSKDKSDAKNRLCDLFSFSELQAEAIVTLRLYRLTSTDIVILKQEYSDITLMMEQLRSIIENPLILKQTIIKELKEIRNQFADERRTMIEDEVEEIVIDKTKLMSNDKVMITLSKDGYLKKVSLRSYGASDKISTGCKEGDELLGITECETLDTLLIFTQKGNYGFIPVYQIEESKWKDVGSHCSSIVKMDSDEKIVQGILIKNFESYAWIVTVTKEGYMKKTPINQWSVARNKQLYMAMKLRDNDEVVSVYIVYDHQNVSVLSKKGMMCCFSIDSFSAQNTKAQGVKAINLADDDEVVSSCVIKEDGAAVLVSETGGLKRIRWTDLTISGRAIKGEMICKRLKSNPYVLRHVFSCRHDELVQVNDGEWKSLTIKDIPFFAKEATFSTPLKLNEPWFWLMDIPECAIIDFPPETETHADFEMINLFDE